MVSIPNGSNKDVNKFPLEEPKYPDILFSIENFKALLSQLGWEYSSWIDFWLERNGQNMASSFWANGTKLDWIWGLGLPFLSDIRRFTFLQNHRPIFGISALPGCGKTSFGNWLEASAQEIGISLKVISLDDFYLPGKEMDIAMYGNPWHVPRGYPGSHSIELMNNALDNFLNTGVLKVPTFDKSLRDGMGDRSEWCELKPKV